MTHVHDTTAQRKLNNAEGALHVVVMATLCTPGFPPKITHALLSFTLDYTSNKTQCKI